MIGRLFNAPGIRTPGRGNWYNLTTPGIAAEESIWEVSFAFTSIHCRGRPGSLPSLRCIELLACFRAFLPPFHTNTGMHLRRFHSPGGGERSRRERPRHLAGGVPHRGQRAGSCCRSPDPSTNHLPDLQPVHQHSFLPDLSDLDGRQQARAAGVSEAATGRDIEPGRATTAHGRRSDGRTTLAGNARGGGHGSLRSGAPPRPRRSITPITHRAAIRSSTST